MTCSDGAIEAAKGEKQSDVKPGKHNNGWPGRRGPGGNGGTFILEIAHVCLIGLEVCSVGSNSFLRL